MRRIILIALVIFFGILSSAIAQDTDTPTSPDPTTDTEQRLTELVERAEAAASQAVTTIEKAEASAAEARNATDLAFNLLGIFEAIGFGVTVVAGIGAAFGVTRLLSAQNELTKARERVEAELGESRQRFAAEMDSKQAELDGLRAQLEQSIEKQRADAASASLAQSLMPLGERQYRSQDYVGALDTYHRSLELDPENLIIHYRLGYVYTQSGELEKADTYLRKALEIEPNFAPALAALGYVYRRMGEKMMEGVDRDMILNKAEERMLSALKIQPKLVDDDGESWWGSLGGLYRRRGQVDQAIYAYKNATEVTPQSSYGFGNLALLYVQKNDVKRMKETYKRVEKLAWNEVQADVDNYWAYADLVVSRLALGMVKEADEILDAALETAPSDSPYTLESLIDTLVRLKEALPEDEIPPVERVIQYTRDFLAKREKQQKDAALKRATAELEASPVGDD